MSTALAIVEDNNHSSTYTPAENLARHIISRMDSVAAKLKSLEDEIRRLWLEFDKLKAGETILGCATKKEFCERKLNRTPQAIRYMLNPELRESKQCLPASPEEPSFVPADQPKRPTTEIAAKPHAEKRKNRNEPVDDFEEVRAVAIKMLNLGLREMKKTEANYSLLDSAKTWALYKLEVKEKA
jgi:hypothetical protein